MPRAKRSITSDAAPFETVHARTASRPQGHGAARAAPIARRLAAGRLVHRMSPLEAPANLIRENAYLRTRNAQLEEDLVSLRAEADRLRQIVERLHGRRPTALPNPLSGGQ